MDSDDEGEIRDSSIEKESYRHQIMDRSVT